MSKIQYEGRQPGALTTISLYLIPSLIALGTLNSKLLGTAWIAFCALGFYLAYQQRNTPSRAHEITALTTAIWFKSCSLAFLLAVIPILFWQDWGTSLNTQWRLFLAATAAMYLARQGPMSQHLRVTLLHAFSFACVLALIWTAYLTMQGPDAGLRISLASNAIAWAVVISFYICLLLPAALSEPRPSPKRRFWLLGIVCGIAAILLSQSRGAFLIMPWCLLVYICFWHREHAYRNNLHRTLLGLAATASITLAAAWFAPGDVLRMHQAVQDIEEVQTSDNYNTSIGARLYLWRMACDGIRSSPWIGIGGAERMRRIKHAGEGESVMQADKLLEVRALGHVHNEYLHAALDGGVVGLASVVALLLGMALAIRHLTRRFPVAAWQLGGVLFMHATASLTNVNFARNYYATALALAVVMPLLSAQHESTPLENS
jgi:O-antigen ligase